MDFRLFSRRVIERIPVESDQGFCYSIELLVKAHRLDWPVAEVPVRWIERRHGQSRFRVLKWLPAYLRWYGYALCHDVSASAAGERRAPEGHPTPQQSARRNEMAANRRAPHHGHIAVDERRCARRGIFAWRLGRNLLRSRGRASRLHRYRGATPAGKIPIVRQFRPAIEDFAWELPAGLVEPGEKPMDCARRELPWRRPVSRRTRYVRSAACPRARAASAIEFTLFSLRLASDCPRSGRSRACGCVWLLLRISVALLWRVSLSRSCISARSSSPSCTAFSHCRVRGRQESGRERGEHAHFERDLTNYAGLPFFQARKLTRLDQPGHLMAAPRSTKAGSCSAANKGDHSMTSSARTSNAGGEVIPSALAVFRFRTRSNFVGCWIGRSPAVTV